MLYTVLFTQFNFYLTKFYPVSSQLNLVIYSPGKMNIFLVIHVRGISCTINRLARQIPKGCIFTNEFFLC